MSYIDNYIVILNSYMNMCTHVNVCPCLVQFVDLWLRLHFRSLRVYMTDFVLCQLEASPQTRWF